LPRVETGDAILEEIKADMPDLKVVDWKFDLDGPRVRISGDREHGFQTIVSSYFAGS